VISSWVYPEDGQRNAIKRQFEYVRQALPHPLHAKSTLCLGSPVGWSHNEREKPAQPRLDKVGDDALKINNSDVMNIQKLDALKNFVMPMVDFLMFWGDAVARSRSKFDAYIPALFFGCKGVPVPFFHMSWRSSLIRMVTEMLKTPDKELGVIIHRFSEEGWINCGYTEDRGPGFLNWSAEREVAQA
jgi:hypothetical protein